MAEKQPLTMSRGAVQYDSSLGETYVNLFAKLGPTQNRKLRGRLIRKYEGQKQKKYGRKVNTEVFKTTLQKNKYDLNSKGFEIVTTVVNNKTYDLIKFPLVRKIKLGRGKDLKYITEKLINVTVPQFLNRGVGESSMMYNLKADGKPSAILGVNAIYKTTETVGVDSATDIGDVFVGKRPAFSLMMENRADRLELNLPMEDFLQLNPTDVAEAVSEEDAGQLDQLSESVSRVTEKGFENNKGESVTPQQAIKKESTQPLGLSGNLSDYQNIIDNSSLDMSGLKEDASETQEVTNEDSAYLSEEYANFTNFQKQNIAVSKDQGGLGVKSLEDLIALYNDPNQQYSREEFIEDIKKCKGK